nr:hypothetical protein [Desulfobacteraceae bacterium]
MSVKIDNRNRPAPLVAQPQASAGRVYYVRCQYLQFFLVHFYPIVPQFSSAATAYPGRETFY